MIRRLIGLAAAVSLTLLTSAASVSAQQSYVIKNGETAGKFTLTRNNIVVRGAVDTTLAYVVGVMRLNAMGDPVAVQFGAGGEDVLDLGTNGFTFWHSIDGEELYDWGDMSFTGSITSSASETFFLSSVRVGHRIVFSANIQNTRAGDGGYALYLLQGDSVTISGGRIESAAGETVFIGNDAVVTVSGAAEIVSNVGSKAAIYKGYGGDVELNLIGGKVTNAAEGGRAVNFASLLGRINLGGSPEIKGSLTTRIAGSVRVLPGFAPGANKYTLDPAGGSRDDGAVVVVGGAAHISSFIFENPAYSLTAKGGDIVLTLPAGFVAPQYTISGNSADLIIAVKGGDTLARNTNIFEIMNFVMADAQGMPCVIKMGLGATDTLSIGNAQMAFDGQAEGGSWGRVTLQGKLISSANYPRGGPIASLTVQFGTTVDNEADIMHTAGNTASAVSVENDANFTHRGGTLFGGLNAYSRSSLTVLDGKVYYLWVSGDGTSAHVSGGVIGDSALALEWSGAVSVQNRALAVINAPARVLSANTGSSSGTIQVSDIGASVTINGATVQNLANNTAEAAAGAAIIQDSDSGRVVITGDAMISSKSRSATIRGSRGLIDISGGTVTNADSGSAVTVSAPAGNEAIFEMLNVSGTANISVSGNNPAIVISGGAYNTNNVMTGGASATISGGTVANTRSDGNGTPAISVGMGRLTVSNTAKINSRARGNGVINNYGELHILGGEIAALDVPADSIPIAVLAPNSTGGTFIGGSPQITGVLGVVYGNSNFTVAATGASAFNPGNKVYELGLYYSPLQEARPVVKNGASFAGNFKMVTMFGNESYVNQNALWSLAASGNDLVSIKDTEVHTVRFNLNDGPHGTPPPAVLVVKGSPLGPLAMPPPSRYVSADGFANDGKWYESLGQTSAGFNRGEEFVFGLGVNGTPVNKDMTLILSWTDIIKVAESAREILDAGRKDETAVVAPVAVVAGEFTAGPNVVSKQAGVVNLFWTGRTVRNGTITVYDASGNVVRKIGVNDAGNGTANTGRRTVGSWDLKDARGRAVAEGTYLVKGDITTTDGRKTRVSVKVGAR